MHGRDGKPGSLWKAHCVRAGNLLSMVQFVGVNMITGYSLRRFLLSLSSAHTRTRAHLHAHVHSEAHAERTVLLSRTERGWTACTHSWG